MEIQNRKIPEGEFMAMRQEVLQQWPTGRDVDLTEAAVYQKQQKPSRNFSARLIEAKKEHKTLIQPRAGVPVLSCLPVVCARCGVFRFSRPGGAAAAPSPPIPLEQAHSVDRWVTFKNTGRLARRVVSCRRLPPRATNCHQHKSRRPTRAAASLTWLCVYPLSARCSLS